jgi:ABC-type transport system involved in multi-copper enzyme maturation permease subunit
VLAVLVLFAIGLMAFSLVLGQLSLHEEVRIMKDLGLAGMSIFGTIIALFLGVNLLSKELDKKTVYAIIPKPLHRWEFLLGKYIGLAVTMAALVTLMAVVLAIFLAFQDGHHGVLMLRAEILILFELWLLMAVAMLFSSFSSPYLSAMLTGALWIIGRNTGELEAFAGNKLEGKAAGTVVEVVLAVVPDFRMFYVSGANFGEGVTSVHGSFVHWGYVAEAGLYGAAYGIVCLLVAVLLFSKRDFV